MSWWKKRDKNRKLYAAPTSKIGIGLWIVAGYSTALALLGVVGAAVSAGEEALAALIVSGLLLVLTGGLMVRERIWLAGAVQRFYEYRGILDSGTICSVDELAKRIGKKSSFVVSDLKKMIQRRWFLEGKLDEQTHYLITNLDTWDAYQKIRSNLVRAQERQVEEAAKTCDARAAELLTRSDVFLTQLLDFQLMNMNAQIVPSVERLVEVIFRVRQEAMEHPEKALNLKSMLDRYLPTVVNLLRSYAKMQGQTGGNNTTQTITQTVDDLNCALEKLLADEMQRRVMDASADISVLKTMMHRDGLTEDELTRLRREAKS